MSITEIPSTAQENHHLNHNNTPLTLVLKLGASGICDKDTHFPLLSSLSSLAETIVKLRDLGHRVILVTSGAVGHFKRGSKDFGFLPAGSRARAAIGQSRLMSLYDDIFKSFDVPIAQILLTRNDLLDPAQYTNAVNTFNALLDFGVIPIVNENDPVINRNDQQIGENDTLSAITAGMVGADYLSIFTDVDCLYTDNPRTHDDAEPVELVKDICDTANYLDSTDEPGSNLGSGGMATKIVAADFAAAAGVETIITNSSTPSNLLSILASLRPHSFIPCEDSDAAPMSPYAVAASAASADDASAAASFIERPASTPIPEVDPTVTTVGEETPYGIVPLHTHFLSTCSSTHPDDPNAHQPHVHQEYWHSKGLDDIVGRVLESVSENASEADPASMPSTPVLTDAPSLGGETNTKKNDADACFSKLRIVA